MISEIEQLILDAEQVKRTLVDTHAKAKSDGADEETTLSYTRDILTMTAIIRFLRFKSKPEITIDVSFAQPSPEFIEQIRRALIDGTGV